MYRVRGRKFCPALCKGERAQWWPPLTCADHSFLLCLGFALDGTSYHFLIQWVLIFLCSIFLFLLETVSEISILKFADVYKSINPFAENIRVMDVAKCRTGKDFKNRLFCKWYFIYYTKPWMVSRKHLQSSTSTCLQRTEWYERKTGSQLFSSDYATKFISGNRSLCRAHRISKLQVRDCVSVYTLATDLGGSSSGNGYLLAPHHLGARLCLSCTT